MLFEVVAIPLQNALLLVPVGMLDEISRARRSQNTPRRDLERDIEAYLLEHPASTTIEVQRGVRARAGRVREALHASDLFRERPARPGVARNAKCWELAAGAPAARPSGRDEHAAKGEFAS